MREIGGYFGLETFSGEEYYTDLLRISSRNCRMQGNSFAIAVTRRASVYQDPVLFDSLDNRLIRIKYTYFVFLKKIACIAASDSAASDKSDSHVYSPPFLFDFGSLS